MSLLTDCLRVARGVAAVLAQAELPPSNLAARAVIIPYTRAAKPSSNDDGASTRPDDDDAAASGDATPSHPDPPPPSPDRTAAKLHHDTPPPPQATIPDPTPPPHQPPMRERSVPESPLSRAFAFGTLGGGLLLGAAAESARRLTGLSTADTSHSALISDANAERLANSLSRMRGAALKLGQMVSIQDESMVPPALLKALERVRQGADVMPARQLERVMREELGEDWRERVERFDERPMAAASIGQVHRGRVEGREVVFKVQYPGVARSIRSDLWNLKRVFGGVLPERFFVDEAVKVAMEELERECDYRVEGESQMRYKGLVEGEGLEGVYVPGVLGGVSGKRVLCTEFVEGVAIDRVGGMGGGVRDSVGGRLLKLSMVELFVFRFQQSDPNWANYLYDGGRDVVNLIDFGAAREYGEEFVVRYLKLIRACARRDWEGVVEESIALGFLTGEESRDMLEAHVKAGFAVGEPFAVGRFDFGDCDIPRRTAEFGKVMLKYRLTPPPREAYSLHRRLSGAFLMSMKLGAVVDAGGALEEVVDRLVRDGRIKE